MSMLQERIKEQMPHHAPVLVSFSSRLTPSACSDLETCGRPYCTRSERRASCRLVARHQTTSLPLCLSGLCLLPAIYLGTTSAKIGQGHLSFSLFPCVFGTFINKLIVVHVPAVDGQAN